LDARLITLLCKNITVAKFKEVKSALSNKYDDDNMRLRKNSLSMEQLVHFKGTLHILPGIHDREVTQIWNQDFPAV
jgi:hypothetical protein